MQEAWKKKNSKVQSTEGSQQERYKWSLSKDLSLACCWAELDWVQGDVRYVIIKGKQANVRT